MNKLGFYFLIVFSSVTLLAQEGNLEIIRNNGPDENRIVLVFLGDGYQMDEHGKYLLDVQQITDQFFQTQPFKDYASFFNIYAIPVYSSESGADHPGTASDVSEPVIPVKEVNNRLGSTFDYGGIHRLLVPINGAEINTILATHLPGYDQAFVVVNSPEYGGSGGQFATSSTHQDAGEIAIHEIGHSFSNLADEYWVGTGFAREAPNMSKETIANQVRWKNWIGDFDIGIYPYGNTGPPAEWNRPHQNCKMRFLGRAFCHVCSEAFIEKIYSLVDPIEIVLPEPGNFEIEEQAEFSVQLIDETLTSQYIYWILNGDTLNTDSNILISPDQLFAGQNKLAFHWYDEPEYSRTFLPVRGYFRSYQWDLFKSATTRTQREELANHFEYSIYPNPSQEYVTLSYKNENIQQLHTQWVDEFGRIHNPLKYNLDLGNGILQLYIPNSNDQHWTLQISDPTTGFKKAVQIISTE